MFDFLVTAKARRRLLLLLWSENAHGTVSELAKRAGVGFASAWRELQAMQALDLLVREHRDGAVVFRANDAHAHAGALRSLMARPSPEPTEEARQTRAQLRALGAPLLTDDVAPPVADVEQTVVRGVRLARRDPSVARSLPVCLYHLRDTLNAERLRECARESGEKHALGFFLDLTSALSQESCFKDWSAALADGRRTTQQEFFLTASRSPAQRAVSKERAPETARRWGFAMNMSFETFQSTFQKHVHA